MTGTASQNGDGPPSDNADTLTQQLLIDIKTSGYPENHPYRAGDSDSAKSPDRLADWNSEPFRGPWTRDKESQEEFDEELRWMGSYANWYSAMQVFLYPENLLLPTLRPVPTLPPSEHTPSVMEKETQTHAFRELIEDLRRDLATDA